MPRKKKKKTVFSPLIIFSLIFIAYLLFLTFSSYGFISWSELVDESSQLDKKLSGLRKKNISLKQEKKLLQSDNEKIEKVAREKYNMKKSGEIVYKIIRKK
jgi:cell division protein FtsB